MALGALRRRQQGLRTGLPACEAPPAPPRVVRSRRAPPTDAVPHPPQGRVPGELMEVFAEKMLQACHALLGVVAELKRNALMNDVAARNAEVASSSAAADAEATELRQRFQQLQQRIDAAMQLVPPLDEGPEAEAAAQQQDRHPQVPMEVL